MQIRIQLQLLLLVRKHPNSNYYFHMHNLYRYRRLLSSLQLHPTTHRLLSLPSFHYRITLRLAEIGSLRQKQNPYPDHSGYLRTPW